MDIEVHASEKKPDTSLASPTRTWLIVSPRELIPKVAAEFIGTFILLFGAAGSSIMDEKSNGQVTYVGVGVAAGLVVMLIIFATGHISGAHVNPAVTIAFATFKHFPWIQVPVYIGAQISGSICASFLLIAVFQPVHNGGVTVPSDSVWKSFLVELLLTFILMFVVTSVSTDTRAVGELAGIAVGATVILNNLVAAGISGASMNPVRSLGPAIATRNFTHLWLYIIGPICGAILGAGAYSLIRLYKDSSNGQGNGRMSSFRHFG